MRTLFFDRKLHCFINLKKSLIYNSNKKISLKDMIYKYKLEIQIIIIIIIIMSKLIQFLYPLL